MIGPEGSGDGKSEESKDKLRERERKVISSGYGLQMP